MVRVVYLKILIADSSIASESLSVLFVCILCVGSMPSDPVSSPSLPALLIKSAAGCRKAVYNCLMPNRKKKTGRVRLLQNCH